MAEEKTSEKVQIVTGDGQPQDRWRRPPRTSKYDLVRATLIPPRMLLGRLRGFRFAPPNYVYLPRFGRHSVVVDVGCCDKPDFSLPLIAAYGLRVLAIDPTRKHAPALAAIAGQYEGRFEYVSAAVSGASGRVTFYESAENDSGSLYRDHSGTRGTFTSYEVESIRPSQLTALVGVSQVDCLKLDIEGAEYELILEAPASEFDAFDQVFVEFHHFAVRSWSRRDTVACSRKFADWGFKVFSVDGTNYLFYR